jgi:hypothetical protein
MRLLNNSVFPPPWALAARVLYETFSPDPWTAPAKSSPRALREMIGEDVKAFRSLPPKIKCALPISSANPGIAGNW